MNIIQVCPYDLSIPGGVQTHVTYLSNQLVQKNHNVIIIAPSLKNSDLVKKFDGEIVHLTGSRRMRLWGTTIDVSVLNHSEKQDFRHLLDEFNPDIIHFHTVWNPIMQTQLLWIAKHKIKCVGTFHDTPPDFGMGKYIGGPLMKLGAKYYLPKMDEIISVSRSQASAMGVNVETAPENFRILPNGIDTTLHEKYFYERKDDNSFKLIFIGRFEGRKGLPDLLRIYNDLKSHPEIQQKKLSLSIIGDGPLKEEAKEYIAENNLNDITFHSEINDEKKFKLLAESDLLVAPSLYGESFGIVLLEAMALGTKVVGYGNKGYLNIGRAYGEENFPEPGNAEALFEVIKTHILKPDSTDYLIEKGHEIAKEHDWAHIAEEIETIYRKLV